MPARLSFHRVADEGLKIGKLDLIERASGSSRDSAVVCRSLQSRAESRTIGTGAQATSPARIEKPPWYRCCVNVIFGVCRTSPSVNCAAVRSSPATAASPWASLPRSAASQIMASICIGSIARPRRALWLVAVGTTRCLLVRWDKHDHDRSLAYHPRRI
jgi:hypothetical protein